MGDKTLGTVYLVGAGPGDPGLLTLRGRELLSSAEVVVYDYLSDTSLLEFCDPKAELIDVGKRPDRPVAQSEINEVLISKAKQAKSVVRLKGGDPFVFGRGGEEALDLIAAGIEFEIVPGVSSAIAVPAYAGVPVTHRGMSTSFTVVTGHRHGKATDQVDWGSLAKLGGTIVVLMGVAHRAEIAEKLIAGGLDPATPVLAVRWGTRSDQESTRTQLGLLGASAIKSPATLVIGEVAKLNLAWFEKRPLLGKRVVVTRTREQSSQLVYQLRQLGASVVTVPTIEIGPPSDNFAKLESAIRRITEFKWVVFTSANTVTRFFERIEDLRVLSGLSVAAIGASTAHEVEKFKIKCDFVPSKFVAEQFVDQFPAGEGNVLLPQAENAREVLRNGLAEKGWNVDVVPAYRNLRPSLDPSLGQQIATSDAITFTSSSTAENFCAAFGIGQLPAKVVSIGPITTATLERLGVDDSVTAERHDITGVVNALLKSLS